MNPPDKPKSAPSRKGPKKAPAQELETQIAEMMAARDAAQKQAMDLHSGFQDLSRRAAELETQVGELDQELKKAREEAAQANARAQDLSSQVSCIAGLEAEAAALRKRLDESLAEHGRLQAELKKLQESRDAAEQENLRKQSADQIQQETLAAALRKQIEEARSAGESSRRELEEARKRLDESRQDHGGLQAELKKLQEATDAALMENARLRMRAADLDLQVKRAQSDLKKVQEFREAAEQEAARLKTQGGELEGLVDGMDEELQKAREDVAKADARSGELESLVGGLEKELEQAGEEAGKSAARAAGLEQRVGELGQELSAQTSRAARLDQEGAALRLQVAQEAAAREEQRRNLDVARQRVMEFTEEHHRLFGEQKQVQENLGAACTENSELKAQRASLADQLKAAEARIADSSRRLEALQRELVEAKSEAKKWEAKARDADSQAAQARETASIRFADLARLEKMRAEQDRHVVDLRSTVADLERRLHEADAAPPVPEPVLILPAPAAPAEKPPSIFDEAPPPQAPVAATIPPAASVPRPVDETTLRSQNWFGPLAEDGQPAHVLMEILSRDSMGVLYRASERSSGRQFAVRFMSGQAGEEQTQAIEREVEKLISLPHPNILHVQGSGRRKNRLYFAMDLVEGQTLGQAKIQEIPRLCAILRDAAAAVHYAHEEGIFHGDLNPENILVGRDGDMDHAIVKDFALGHFLETAAASSTGKDAPPVIRNPAYLPPEQVRVLKSGLSAAVDVYGLGATLYAMLAGRPPFEGKDAAQITKRIQIEEPPPIERVRPDVPPAVAAVARRAMAKERGLRYATAQELADALTKFLDGH